MQLQKANSSIICTESGISSVFNDLQSENANLDISTIDDGKMTFSRLQQFSNTCGFIFSKLLLFEKSIFTIFLQFLNAWLSTIKRLLPDTIYSSEKQFEKQESPSVFIFFKSKIPLMFLQFSNA